MFGTSLVHVRWTNIWWRDRHPLQYLNDIAQCVQYGTPEQLGRLLDDNHGLFDINAFGYEGANLLRLAAHPDKLGQGASGGAMFRRLLSYGADPRKICTDFEPGNIVDYLHRVWDLVEKTPVNPTLMTIIRDDGTGTVDGVREAIPFIKDLIRERYPKWQIPDPAAIRAAIETGIVVPLPRPVRSPSQAVLQDRPRTYHAAVRPLSRPKRPDSVPTGP